MALDSTTVANRNRAIRQQALRDMLAAKGLETQAIECIEKMAHVTDPFELNKLKVANDQRLKLLNKYLPDLRSVEITGDPSNPLQVSNLDASKLSDEALKELLNARTKAD